MVLKLLAAGADPRISPIDLAKTARRQGLTLAAEALEKRLGELGVTKPSQGADGF
jgi:hypothetical protein